MAKYFDKNQRVYAILLQQEKEQCAELLRYKAWFHIQGLSGPGH